MAITLSEPPGFVDVPESLAAAEAPALGLVLQRSVGNAKMGMVRPEIFISTNMAHGSNVPLPTSPVDGYTYQRDELIYLWSYGWTGSPSGEHWATGPGAIWYFGCGVDQTTGDVTSQVKYLKDASHTALTNDGWLTVFTIGVRRRTGLMMSSTPVFVDHPDSDYALDDALAHTPLLDLLRNSKFAAIASEAIYMGEFVNGDTIPRPVSPVDGYEYRYDQVDFASSWRWSCQGDSFADPAISIFLALLQSVGNLAAFSSSVDGAGNVSTAVTYAFGGTGSSANTTHGRIAVVAFCRRDMPALAAPGGSNFVDLAESLFDAGAPLRDDAAAVANQNAKYAALRPEFFVAEYHHGAVVPTPTSPIDGYAYTRDELEYAFELVDSASYGDRRLLQFAVQVDPTNGAVAIHTDHLSGGGNVVGGNGGTARVITVARRGHVTDSTPPPALTGGSTAGAEGQELLNPSFDRWSTNTQSAADDWWMVDLSGAVAAARATTLDGSDAAQSIAVTAAGAGNRIGVRSSKLVIKENDLRYFGAQVQGSVATTNGLRIRVLLMNADYLDQCYVDVVADAALTGDLQAFDLWLQVPKRGDTTVQTSRGTLAIVGTLDFLPAWAHLEFMLDSPNVSAAMVIDAVSWSKQLNPAAGQVAQRGSNSLAFFPAIHITWTDSTAAIDLDFDLQRTDGSITVPANKGTVNITGLTASTQYALELYYDELTGLYAAMATGHGSNGWAYLPSELTRDLAALWAAQSHLPLSNAPVYFTTNALPTDPGGGGYDGGDGGCPRSDMYVREQTKGVIKVAKVGRGDRLWSRDDTWVEVEDCNLIPHDLWAHFAFSNGVAGLAVTSGHTFQCSDGETRRAWDMSLQTEIPCPTGRTAPTSIELWEYDGLRARVRCKEPHVYFASPDGVHWVLIHNIVTKMQTA
jgi:hypothetical protein